MGELKSQIAANDETLRTVEAEYRTLMLSLPNLPRSRPQAGRQGEQRAAALLWEPHKFDFPPKHHVDLCTDLGFIDYTRGEAGRVRLLDVHRPGGPAGVGSAELFY